MGGHDNLTATHPPVDESVTYTYRRADGTMERASTAEEAFARCPVLGRMAIEAPDQANVLLSLSMDAVEAISVISDETHDPLLTDPEVEDIKPRRKIDPQEFDQAAPSAVRLSTGDTSPLRLRDPVAKTDMARGESSGGHPVLAKAPEAVSLAASLGAEGRTGGSSSTKIAKVQETVQAPAQIKEQPAELAVLSRESVTAATVHERLIDDETHVSTVGSPTLAAAISPEIVSPIDTEKNKDFLKSGPDAEIESVYATATPQLERAGEEPADQSLREDYKQTRQHEHSVSSGGGDRVDEASDTPQSYAAPVPRLDVENFMAIRPVSEAPVELGVLREAADNQSVEESLAQLVEMLADDETVSRAEDPNQAALHQAIRSLHALLPLTPRTFSATMENSEVMTAEMTEQILCLLREMGYTHPDQVLGEFITKYQSVALLDILGRICRLQNRDRQYEISLSSSPLGHATNDTLRGRVGKMLFGFVAKNYGALV